MGLVCGIAAGLELEEQNKTRVHGTYNNDYAATFMRNENGQAVR